jgi:hypothetical protein
MKKKTDPQKIKHRVRKICVNMHNCAEVIVLKELLVAFASQSYLSIIK